MKKLLALLLAFCILLSFTACDEGSETTSEQSGEKKSELIKSGDCSLKYLRSEIGVDYNGDYAIIAHFDFTNNSDDVTTFYDAFTYHMEQDEQMLPPTVVGATSEYEMIDDSVFEDVDPGECEEITLTCVLDNLDDTVELMISATGKGDYEEIEIDPTELKIKNDPDDKPAKDSKKDTERTEVDGEFSVDDYAVEYLYSELVEDADGNDAIAVYMNYTNNSDEEESFQWAIYCKAFQDDEELDQTNVWLDPENYVTLADSTREKVEPGESKVVVMTFELENSRTPVLMEFYETDADAPKSFEIDLDSD